MHTELPAVRMHLRHMSRSVRKDRVRTHGWWIDEQIDVLLSNNFLFLFLLRPFSVSSEQLYTTSIKAEQKQWLDGMFYAIMLAFNLMPSSSFFPLHLHRPLPYAIYALDSMSCRIFMCLLTFRQNSQWITRCECVCVQLLSATHWPANRYLMEQNGIDDDDGWGPAAREKNWSDFRNFKLFTSFELNVIVVGIIAIGDASIGRGRRCRVFKTEKIFNTNNESPKWSGKFIRRHDNPELPVTRPLLPFCSVATCRLKSLENDVVARVVHRLRHILDWKAIDCNPNKLRRQWQHHRIGPNQPNAYAWTEADDGFFVWINNWSV